MPLELSRVVAVIAMASMAVGCTSAATEQATGPSTLALGSLPPVVSTTAPADGATTTVVTTVPATTLPATVPPTAPPPTVAAACDQTDGVLTTPSGRHVLLRAKGVSPGSPLVFIIHGYTGTPTGIEKYAEFTAMANAASVAVAYPEGTPVTGSEGFGWNSGSGIFSTSGVDDVAALVEMFDAVIATGCVDPSAITLSGESNGAAITLVSLCDARLRDRITSAVMVIPAVDGGVLAHCAPGGRPLPLSVVTGLLDKTAPYQGGRGTLLPQEDWFTQAASLVNGCAPGEPTREQFDAHTQRLMPAGCGACTEMFAIDDGTHTWPGTSRGVAGLRPGTFDLDGRLLALALSRKAGCLT